MAFEVLSPKVIQIDCLMKDSYKAATRLAKFQLIGVAKLIHLDILDFYLRGSPSGVALDVACCFDGSLSPLVFDATFLLLDPQYMKEHLYATTDFSMYCLRLYWPHSQWPPCKS